MLQFDLFSFCDRKDITKEGLASLFGGLHFILPTIQSVDGCGLQKLHSIVGFVHQLKCF